MSGRVNLWEQPAWAQRYLAERDGIPHRMEGFGVLLELLPERVLRVLDLGTGDGFTLDLVLKARAEASGVGLDFQEEMLSRARTRFEHEPRAAVRAHDLDAPLPGDLTGFDLVVSSFAIHHCDPSRQRALYGEVFGLLQPGGSFFNFEHVASPTTALHHDFLAAIGKTPEQDDPSNQLVDVGVQAGWLRELGYENADCFWKWRELALFGGTKPVRAAA